MNKSKIGLLVVLLGIMLAGRLLDHPANFAPVAAAALFASVYIGRQWGPLAAVGAMFMSDAVIGFYDWRLMLAVYGSFALVGLLGRLLNRRSSLVEVLGVSVLASFFFFATTNAAVWLLTPAYSRGIDGLMSAYVMGLPFLRNTLAGDMAFSFGLFGLVKVLEAVKVRSTARLAVKAELLK